MLRFMKVAALLAGASLAGAAAAQGPGKFAPVEHTVTQAFLSQAMGRCVLKRNRVRAVAVAAAREAVESERALNALKPDLIACLANQHSATLSPLYVTSAIAEQLLNEDGGALLAKAAVLTPAAPVRVPAGDSAGRATIGCAVGADPADAVAMLRTEAATPAEAAAFRKLAAALQDCVPARGEVSIKPYVVRASVAIATFHAVQGRDGQTTQSDGARRGMNSHA